MTRLATIIVTLLISMVIAGCEKTIHEARSGVQVSRAR